MKKADIIKEIEEVVDFEEVKRRLNKGEVVKVQEVNIELLKAKLEGYNLAEMNFKKMIDEKIKSYEKWWLNAHKKGDKQTEDIFYNTLTNLKELKKTLEEE